MHGQHWDPLAWQVLENPYRPPSSSIRQGQFLSPAPITPSTHPTPPATRPVVSPGSLTPMPGAGRGAGGACGSPAPPGPPSAGIRLPSGVRAPEPGALRAVRSAAGVSGTICSVRQRSALCVKLPSPLAPPSTFPSLPIDSRDSKEKKSP